MSEEPETEMTTRDAFDLADRCIRMKRPLGWRAVKIIVEEALRQPDSEGDARQG